MPTNPEKNEAPKPETKKKAENGTSKKLKVSPKLSLVQDVILLMNDADLSELSFEQGSVKIHLRRGPGMSFPTAVVPIASSAPLVANPAAPAAVDPAGAPASAAPPAKTDNTVSLNSPMVGTFYRSSTPETKSFIEEGDKIAVGQVYCIIEAMKLMNEVKSEVTGKVVKIIAQNGQAVEFNQPLIIVDPS